MLDFIRLTDIIFFFRSYFFDALHPVLNILKGFFISDVVHKDDALQIMHH